MSKYAAWILKKSGIEQPLFQLPGQYSGQFKYDAIHPQLEQAFAGNAHPLSGNGRVTYRRGCKWKIQDGVTRYVVRTAGEGLLVSAEMRPALARVAEGASRVIDYLRYDFRPRIRDETFMIRTGLRKRIVERPAKVMVNIGAGLWHQNEWRILDYSGGWYRFNRLYLDFAYDLVRGRRLPFADDSVDLFYSEHVFEHIPNERVQFVFEEIHRALRPGGGIRIVVPDADLIYERFGERDRGFFQTWIARHDATLEEAFLVLVAHPREPFDAKELWENFHELPKEQFLDLYAARMKYDYRRAGEHINWFNQHKIERMLKKAGFESVDRSTAQGSRWPEIRGPRFDTRPSWSLHVDAVKRGS